MADTIGAIGIPIVADDSGLVRGIDHAMQRLDNFAKTAPKAGQGFWANVVGNANDATNKFENGVGGIATAFSTASTAARDFGATLAQGDFAGAFAGMAQASSQVVSQMVGYGVLRHAVHALTSPIGLVVAGLGAVYTVGRNAIHAIAELNDTALKFGMSAEDFQKFSFALSQVGVEGDNAGAIMAKLRAKLGDLAAGEEAAAKAFERLGLDRQALAGKDTSEAMGLISDRLRAITDNNIRASVAMDIFGKQWSEIEEFALRGSGFFARAAQQAQRFGVVLDNSVVASLEETSDRADEMIAAWATVGTFIRNQTALTMQPIIDAVTPVLMRIRETIQPVLNILGRTTQLIGQVVGGAADIVGRVVGPILDGIGTVFGWMDRLFGMIGEGFARLAERVTRSLENAAQMIQREADRMQSQGGQLGFATRFGLNQLAWMGIDIRPSQMIEEEAKATEQAINSFGTLAESWAASAGGVHKPDDVWNTETVQQYQSELAKMPGLIQAVMNAFVDASIPQQFVGPLNEAAGFIAFMEDAVKDLFPKETSKEMKEASDFLTTLQGQIDNFGLSTEEIRLQAIKELGPEFAEVAGEIERAIGKLKEMRAEKTAFDELARGAEQFANRMRSIAESVKSPIASIADQIADLNFGLLQGTLNTTQHALALKKLIDQHDKMEQATASPTFALRGSAAAFSAILQASRQVDRRTEDPQARVARILEQQRRIDEQQLAEAKLIRAALERAPVVVRGGG